MAESPGQTTSLSSKGQEASSKACRSSSDKISRLPDDLIHRILSFLPTKDAMATAVLSKRWVRLWTLVPTLDLEDSSRCGYSGQAQMKFMHFVYRVLLLNKARSVEKFRLNCNPVYGYSCVSTWIWSAIERDLQEVDIFIDRGLPEVERWNEDLVKMPGGLFLMKTLKILKLQGKIMVDVPGSVCLPSLKILHLIEVNQSNFESIGRFISGCLSLEELRIDARIKPENAGNLSISAPTLNSLSLDIRSIDGLPGSLGIKFEINAPALKYLKLYSSIIVPHQHSVDSFPCLIEANVFLLQLSGLQLFSALNGVKCLKLLWLLTPLALAGNAFPLFANLTRLELHLRTDRRWFVLSLFLRKSPKLETLVVHDQIFTSSVHGHHSWRWPKKVPKCFLSSLTSACFKKFEGLEDELKMAEYFLRNAKELRTMEICTKDLSSDSKLCFLKKLSMFPRSSKTCQLSFN